jgi:hypothetical protein
MNKYQLYKQIRQELAIGCDRELNAVSDILESGVMSLNGANATLDVGSLNSLNSMSESGRVFREELGEAVRVILERYRRSLQKEIASLGLDDVRAEQPQAPDTSAARAVPLDLDRLMSSAERLARPTDLQSIGTPGKVRINEARS